MGTKTCNKCKQTKSVDEFHSNNQSNDGYSWSCKACVKEYRYNKAISQRVTVDHKICNKCGEYKDISNFSKSASSKDGHIGSCKSCDKESYLTRADRPKTKVNTKTCFACKVEKPSEEFFRCSQSSDGLSSVCKVCDSERSKERQSRLIIKEVESKVCSVCGENKPASEFHKADNLKDGLYSMCKVCKNIRRKEYVAQNKGKINKARMDKYNSNLQFRMSVNLRGRLNIAMKKGVKSGSAVKDLGCTIDELKEYLESKFSDGMTWDNWSIKGWHIDHIIPLASFDLCNRDEFLKACHYTNLQPMWASENIKKNKYV